MLRCVSQGVPSAKLAREIGLSRQTVMSLCRVLQSKAEAMQPSSALSDKGAETDEMFQNAGEKGERHEPLETCPVGAETNAKATAPTPTTVLRWLALSVARVVV